MQPPKADNLRKRTDRFFSANKFQIVVCDNDAAKDWIERDEYKEQGGSDPRAL